MVFKNIRTGHILTVENKDVIEMMSKHTEMYAPYSAEKTSSTPVDTGEPTETDSTPVDTGEPTAEKPKKGKAK